MSRRKIAVLTMLGMCLAATAFATPTQWTVGSGGNGHYYEVIATPGGIAWTSANSAAQSSGGYLATLTSAAEHGFVYGLASGIPSVWVNADGTAQQGPWLGGFQSGGPEPAGGWQWVTGEAWAYTHWGAGNPDNCCGGQDRLHFWKLGTAIGDDWDDAENAPWYGVRGYVVEYDHTVTAVSPTTCLTPSQTCLHVPIALGRSDAVNIRGYSVSVQLSSNLTLCSGLASITEGGYLSGIGATAFQVLDNGGGSYTIDCAILGLPCGATASSGTLFGLDVARNGSDGIGTVTVTSVLVRDCSNGPLAFNPGAPASITIDTAAPTAIANLTATQVKLGNDGDGTTKLALGFAAPGDAATVEVYRKGYGGYPQYDENGGAVPTSPPAYPPAGWTLTGVTASGGQDEPPARDVWSYVAYTKDACGNVSGVSNLTGGTLNYHLGDVTDGLAVCAGNNLVNTADVSLLGAHYGAVLAVNDPLECLDVGPTTTNTVDGRPTTDNHLQFEDLILYAINYGQVSAPQDGGVGPAVAGRNALELRVPELPGVGAEFSAPVVAEMAGDVQGLSVRVAYDAAGLEWLGVEPGELLARQGGEALALSSGAGDADVVRLGTGATLRGSGELARVRFRVRAAGAAAPTLGEVDARDIANRAVAMGTAGGPGAPATPDETALAVPAPNPSSGATTLAFTLAREGRVELAVYGLDGRRVRTLVAESRTAGGYRAVWDGRDDAGRLMRAGMYYARLSAGAVRLTRTLIRLP